MKAMQEHIDFPLQTAVKVKWQKKAHFTYPWHFHGEYEILYILEGSGTSFVADNTERFGPGDLALLGSNLPHFWRSDNRYHLKDSTENINYIVIQFPENLFSESFFSYPEFHLIQELLSRSSRGIRFLSPFTEKAAGKMMRISKKSGFERVILLLQILHEMAKTDLYRLLAGELYHRQDHDFSDDRLTRVLHYLKTGYQKKIDLNRISEVAHLHPSAFCRFFKEKTGKTLSEYVNDMRISYACKLILEGRLLISQICYESGYNNLANFHRAFRRHTGMTPKEYYHHFLENIG